MLGLKPDVKAAWLDARYQEVKRSALEEMRSRYKVVVVPLDQSDLSDLRTPGAAGTAQEPISQ
ncbi:hypothetical protein [Mesorhizobium sp. CN2-181]|uniref:hypothetical protein n=1 Tax=Mesorhizobium yinganensis TaxID=3157707 RepID=UPI0032B7119A